MNKKNEKRQLMNLEILPPSTFIKFNTASTQCIFWLGEPSSQMVLNQNPQPPNRRKEATMRRMVSVTHNKAGKPAFLYSLISTDLKL